MHISLHRQVLNALLFKQRPNGHHRMKVENTKAQMRKGVLEYCILGVLAQGELYPSDIISKLKEAKLIVVEGTLYPLPVSYTHLTLQTSDLV